MARLLLVLTFAHMEKVGVKREKTPSTHIFIGVKSRYSGHRRDHESGEQAEISFKNFGLYINVLRIRFGVETTLADNTFGWTGRTY